MAVSKDLMDKIDGTTCKRNPILIAPKCNGECERRLMTKKKPTRQNTLGVFHRIGLLTDGRPGTIQAAVHSVIRKVEQQV